MQRPGGLGRSLRRRFVDALQRGLFDDAAAAGQPATAPAAEALPVHAPAPEPVHAPALEPEPVPAPERRPAAEPDDGLLRHPRAARSARIEGIGVHYALRRTRRRTIGFSVGGEGLTVSAPKWVALKDIDAAVAEKGRWILAKLAEQRERARRLAAARIVWADGARIPYLGRPVTLALDGRHGLAEGEAVLEAGTPPLLRVGLPREASEARVQEAVQSWLQREARRVFAERAAHFAARLGVKVTRLSLSSASTRWGSANANGSVRLHWRLIHHPLATIDYVVAHELAHLREMNHGPRFWAVVRSVVPDYEAVRLRLRLRDDAAAGDAPAGAGP